MMTEPDWGDISLGKRSFIKTDIAEPPPEFYKVSARRVQHQFGKTQFYQNRYCRAAA
ncbi:hypothetical protein [Leyella lascolaii]|uniref:Uncharacterized protein n=1 Tax=Leyella lascolaii TaxID=1776379 RepID=A0AAW7JH44_9BACT|nr:hypothetical protein [Leyella lascolaii]MDN0021706.1 hypothetical protein [Leyella lascolaii]MDN0024202.1 hypothetical protein [Leyella lascolaii]